MGAGQSSGRGNEDAQKSEVKTSYYELLEITKDATDDEIKKAYRKKALELHPDRNYGDVERTTSLFAEVQSAYEVLSDPQERAWYDSHEDAILRNFDPTQDDGDQYEKNVGLTSADDITRMMGRFHGKVEFSDSPTGFFGFLRETFEQLAKEEEKAAVQQNTDVLDFPSFGHKDDTHDEVVKRFYGAWTGFYTKKTFSWKDRYSMRGVGDRRTRRAIEKENKHFRDEGVREFNEAVRSLVAFVKKRDPRYKPNAQSEADRQNALRQASQAQAARMRAANAAKMEKEVLPEWAKVREPEELDEEEEEEESEEEQFECVACRKTFKSENQFEAHKKSKKHQKAVHALRKKLQKEGKDLDILGDDSSGENEDDAPQDVKLAREDEHQDAEHIDYNRRHAVDIEVDLAEDTNDLALSDSETLLDDEEILDINSPTEKFEEETFPETTLPTSQSIETPAPKEHTRSPSPPASDEPKKGKAAQKRAKKAAAAAANAEQAALHKCVSCGSTFSSKTRLFQHIKDWDHAAPISVTGAKGGKKGKR